jgi:hypothetical protein
LYKIGRKADWAGLSFQTAYSLITTHHTMTRNKNSKRTNPAEKRISPTGVLKASLSGVEKLLRLIKLR